MSATELLPTLICALIVIISIVILGIYGTKARIRYVSFANELRENGKYGEWSIKNRNILFSEKFSIYAFMISFIGFIITGVFKIENIMKFFVICFVVFCLSGVISSFVLYRKVPEE